MAWSRTFAASAVLLFKLHGFECLRLWEFCATSVRSIGDSYVALAATLLFFVIGRVLRSADCDFSVLRLFIFVLLRHLR